MRQADSPVWSRARVCRLAAVGVSVVVLVVLGVVVAQRDRQSGLEPPF